MWADWDTPFDFLITHGWGAVVSAGMLVVAALGAYASQEIRSGTNWLLGPFTRAFPWNRDILRKNLDSSLSSNFTLVEVFLVDAEGRLAQYQKTSNYRAIRKLSFYREGVAAEGRASSFSTMRGTIVGTSHEHGFYLSHIDLGEMISEGARLTNVYKADLHDCFTKQQEHWTQEVAFQTEYLTIQIHFPEARPPKSVTCKTIDGTTEKPANTSAKILELFGKKSIVWDVERPKPNTVFKLEWTW